MQNEFTTIIDHTKWAELLKEAVTKPGLIHSAFSAFHGYSIGNQILAYVQCFWRGIQPSPIATYNAWKAKGRQVRRGEKAIELCMPIISKRLAENEGEDARVITSFVYKRLWFVLSQTEGAPFEMPPLPAWVLAKALETLSIKQIEFTKMNGNILGYARGREFALNPVNPMPWETTFHELGHILLGHTAEGAFADGETMPRNLREVEAESVALLCCESLGLPGSEYARGYIQNWLAGDVIPEKSAQKIFHAADQILRAGRVEVEKRAC
jgi:hypothetical protein